MAQTGIAETESIMPAYQAKMSEPIAPLPDVNSSNNTKSTFKIKKQPVTDPSKLADLTKLLEPANKNLTSIESQRIMAVFEDSIKKAEIVTALPFITENIERFKISLGSELVDVLKRHDVIQTSYSDIRIKLDELVQRRSVVMAKYAGRDDNSLDIASYDFEEEQKSVDEFIVADNIDAMVVPSSRRQSNVSFLDSRIEEVMRNLSIVAVQVSDSCKNILRLFASNPAATKIATGDPNSREEGGRRIIKSMNELKEILMHKLLTTPEEETDKIDHLDKISKEEKKNEAIIERQEILLKAAMDDKEKAIQKKNNIIKALQTDLDQIEKFSDENIRRTRAEAEKQEIADAKNSDQKIEKLQTDINQLQAQLSSELTEHREKEADLRAKKYKIENEVETWIQKYDQDMGERQDEYEEIDIVYTEEKKQLFELEERFAILEAEYLSIMLERRVERDERDRLERWRVTLVRSATIIQAFWRSHKVRKALKVAHRQREAKAKKEAKLLEMERKKELKKKLV